MKEPSDDSPLWEMLAQWEQSAQGVQSIDPEILCRDHPELLSDLREAIAALRKTAWLDRPLCQPPRTTSDVLQTSFGDYELLDFLGAGGMGRVFKARHRLMDRIVAVKILKPGTLSNTERVKRFQDEVKTAARLTHPNIVAAYDAGRLDNGTLFLVMEFVDGPDLTRLVRIQGPLAIEEAIDVIIQTANGLAYAHQQGVLHLDVKPGNLLRGAAGVVKLLDLGIARCLDAAPPSSDEMLSGTVDFLAPEQTHPPHRVDQRTDIYSLGGVGYFLLTGQPIFPGTTVPEVIQAHRNRLVPTLRSRRPEVPNGLDRAIQKMVAKQPEDRQQTMAEVISDLKLYLPEERARRTRRWFLGLSLLAGTAGAGGLARGLWPRPRIEPPFVAGISRAERLYEYRQDDVRSVAVSSNGKYVLTGSFNTNMVRLHDAANGWMLRSFPGHTKKVHGVTFSPDDRLAASCGGDDDSTIRLWSVETGELVKVLRGHVGGVWCVAFLPGGRQLLSGGHDTTLRLWDVASGQEIRKYEGHTQPVFKVAVSPNGEHALSGGADNHIIYRHLGSGNVLHDFRGHATAVWCVAISSDGRRGLSGDQAGIVRVWDLAAGREERRLLASTEAVFAVAWHPDGRRAVTAGGGGWRSKHEGEPHVPDRVVYARGEVNDITLWDCDTGTALHHFVGHTDSVWGLAFDPTGDWFISGSRDKTIRLWRMQAGSEVIRRNQRRVGVLDARLTAHLNDLSEWTIHRGDWEQEQVGISGSGDSLLAWGEPLPLPFALEFDMVVVRGIRPRIHLTDTGLFLGNEGFQHRFGICANETGQYLGLAYPYRVGERLAVRATLLDEHLTLDVNDDTLHTARCPSVRSTALSIRGGDDFSKGRVVYSNFRFFRLKAPRPELEPFTP